MPSFDIVSEVDVHHLTNAVDQANRVVETRFDFKGVDAKFERNDWDVVVTTDSDFQLKQMVDMLRGTLVKNEIDPMSMDIGKVESAGKQVKQIVTMRHGLDKEISKKIVKLIKDSKMKVQAAIQGEQVRVTGKKRDDLQSVISLLKEADLAMPLQFNNFRD